VATPGTPPHRGRLDLDEYVEGIRRGDRVVLARAITLVESTLPSDADLAVRLLDALLSETGRSRRVGITGVPGVGKSTFIDALGMHIVRGRGERVAVLTVDPSSAISGGSILGDKVRMETLANEPGAFVRPSASRGRLGGVAAHTREAILLCEAAGYRNVLVETVGVGQSETAVRSMTDFFLLLMLPGAGDELQGVKRGIMEVVDAVAITKVDGDNRPGAERARAEYRSALHLFPASPDGWIPRVLMCSALTGEGIAEIWQMVLEHHEQQNASGHLQTRRSRQAVDWMHELIGRELERRFQSHPAVADVLPGLEDDVAQGRMVSRAAAREALTRFGL
jgi:LAO/AO transport system kinase